uniref:Protein YIPF n=1 Tax=Cacopsylla melanoneura TaxID=428564 RepID=A0A8D9EJ75_9HEMI
MTSPPGDHRVNFYDEFQASGTAQAEGSMNIPGINKNKTTGAPEYNTLDEPIKTTIMRDLTAVGVKFRHVLQPQEKSSLLKEWDLWGPLLLCTFMAIVLQGDSDDRLDHDGGPQFAEVFVIVWIGSAVVTLNSKLLGGNISFFQSVCVLGYCLSLAMSLVNLVLLFVFSSFFQSVCVLGYCLLPLAMSLVLCRVILFVQQTHFLFFLRFVITMVGFGWATFASVSFLGDSQPSDRKGLAVYPIFLFYLVIAWLILSHSVV